MQNDGDGDAGSQRPEVDGRYPLGRPTKPEPAPVQEWVPVDSATPWIQRSLVTGKWRNVRPAPSAKQPAHEPAEPP